MPLVYFTFYEATFGEAADTAFHKRFLLRSLFYILYLTISFLWLVIAQDNYITEFQDGFAIPDESEIPEEFWGSKQPVTLNMYLCICTFIRKYLYIYMLIKWLTRYKEVVSHMFDWDYKGLWQETIAFPSDVVSSNKY